MTRSRASARNAGTWLETCVAGYLNRWVDDRIERRRQTGAKDKGDIASLRHMGGRIVVQCKEYGGQANIGPWLKLVDIQRRNDDATAGFVVAKRSGSRKPGDQVVIMSLCDLVALMTGERPGEQSEGVA